MESTGLGLGEDAAALQQLLAEEAKRPVITGVLALGIRQLRRLFTGHFSGDTDINVQVEVTLRNVTKRTGVVRAQYGVCHWNSIKHFPIPRLVRDPRHPFNIVKIELFGFEAGREHEVQRLGSLCFQLHEVIRMNPASGWFQVTRDNLTIGELALDVTFHYGLFGYGYSNQVRQLGRAQHELLASSLFPRVNPPEDRLETSRMTLVPKAVKHPTFLLAEKQVKLGYGRDINPYLDKFGEQPCRYANLESSFQRYPESFQRLSQLRNKLDRLRFLHDHVEATHKLGETKQDPLPAAAAPAGSAPGGPPAYMQYVRPMWQPEMASERPTRRRAKTISSMMRRGNGSAVSSGDTVASASVGTRRDRDRAISMSGMTASASSLASPFLIQGRSRGVSDPTPMRSFGSSRYIGTGANSQTTLS